MARPVYSVTLFNQIVNDAEFEQEAAPGYVTVIREISCYQPSGSTGEVLVEVGSLVLFLSLQITESPVRSLESRRTVLEPGTEWIVASSGIGHVWISGYLLSLP